MKNKEEIIASLRGKLVVSCQDYTEIMIDAAIRGGAAALRINSPHDVRVAREKTNVPIIACNKMYFPGSPIYITPSCRAARALARAGAEIVAFDATRRKRVRQEPAEIIDAIHQEDSLALADLSNIVEAEPAIRDGADILATTLAPDFNLQFIRDLVSLGLPVLAEGHIATPEQASQAKDAGVWALCVGTAITRPHLLTAQFREAFGE
jgi:putative N-acetylmannosamine-6-phosphate epimerase